MNVQQNRDFIQIVQLATKAPSGHNTQPWQFKLNEQSIEILPVFNCALPVVDGTNRELFISLGCALENLCIASNQLGYDTRIESMSEKGIVVQLSKSGAQQDNPLFHQIEKRQSNRSVYDKRKIPADTIKIIADIPLGNGIRTYFSEIGSPLADTLTQYIAKGNESQMNDNSFKNELLSWMRFNQKQIDKTGDGLTYKALGVPSIPSFIARPIVNLFLKPSEQNKSDLKKINSSSHLILFTTQNNSLTEWIDLGRVLQRFLLKTTELGIANAYMNQPCEVHSLAEELQSLLPINGEFPTLLIRIGYAKPTAYSPRKNVENVIIRH